MPGPRNLNSITTDSRWYGDTAVTWRMPGLRRIRSSEHNVNAVMTFFETGHLCAARPNSEVRIRDGKCRRLFRAVDGQRDALLSREGLVPASLFLRRPLGSPCKRVIHQLIGSTASHSAPWEDCLASPSGFVPL